jgi:hypothetical protein
MAVNKSSIIAASLAAGLSGISLWASPWTATQAQARGPYDGAWSVLIVTDSGTCDRGYRYAVRISDGRVSYDDPTFNVTGHVDARGNVSVGVRAGDQYANGTGHLSGDYGDGHWSGHSPTSACSGHWEAERRG